MYQDTPQSEERLVDSENTYIYSIKILHHYNSAVKYVCVCVCVCIYIYIYALSIDFKFLHLAHASTPILQITIIIL